MKFSAREIAMAAMFAALAVIAASLFRFGAPLVPFSLVPLVAMLAGMLGGPRVGALGMFVYLLLGLMGLPVFERAPFGGPAYVIQPTFGFLIGYILQAYICGKILAGRKDPGIVRFLLASLAGLAALYITGLPYLYLILNYYMGSVVPVLKVLQIGFLPFIAFDLAKAATASFLARAVARRIKTVV